MDLKLVIYNIYITCFKVGIYEFALVSGRVIPGRLSI